MTLSTPRYHQTNSSTSVSNPHARFANCRWSLILAQSFVLVGAYQIAAIEQAPLREVADQHVIGRSKSGHAPSCWQGATTADTLPVQAGSITAYECRLKAGESNAGYVLVAVVDNNSYPVMWSGSDCPKDYVKAFSFNHNVGRLPQPIAPLTCQIQTGIPMVGIPLNTPEDLRPSSVACGAIAILYWAETRAQQALLYSYDRSISLPPDFSGSHFVTPAELSATELDQFEKEWSNLYQDPMLFETIIAPSGSHMYRCKDPAEVFRRMGPLLRSHLRRSLSSRARLQLLEREASLGMDIGKGRITPGAVNALALQSYLDGSLLEGLNTFMASRGLLLRWVEKTGSELDSGMLPCLVVGPDNQTLVIAGFCGDSPDWVVASIPETVTPDQLSQVDAPERLRQRILRVIRPDSQLAQLFRMQSEKHRREAASGLNQSRSLGDSEQRLFQDADLEYPKAMVNGLHVVSKAAVANWRIILLSGVPATAPE